MSITVSYLDIGIAIAAVALFGFGCYLFGYINGGAALLNTKRRRGG